MFAFLYARHRDLYLRLAVKYWKSPERIYKLAHGSRAKNEKERKILHELLDIGLIHRSSSSHSHSSSRSTSAQ